MCLFKIFLTYVGVLFLISNFRRVLNALCLLLGNSPAYEFYMPTFRNILFHLHRQIGAKNDWVRPSQTELTLSLSLSLTHYLSLTLSNSLSLTNTRTHALTHSLTHPPTTTLAHSLSLSHSHTVSHSCV